VGIPTLYTQQQTNSFIDNQIALTYTGSINRHKISYNDWQLKILSFQFLTLDIDIEDECHFLIQCPKLEIERKEFLELISKEYKNCNSLDVNNKFIWHLSIFYEYQQFFQHRICFSIQPPDYSDP
jgi:hypothetical protein